MEKIKEESQSRYSNTMNLEGKLAVVGTDAKEVEGPA